MARFKHALRRRQPVVRATFVLVGPLLMVIALFAKALLATADTPRCGRSSSAPMVKYIRSGRLSADVSTARYMIKYLLEPEVGRKASVAGLAPVSSSFPTNQTNHTPTQPGCYGTVL